MKKLHLLAALLAALLSAPGTPLGAQILTTTDLAYSATPLFSSSPDYVITGIVSDNASRIFYLENDGSFPLSLPTRLWRRTINDGTAGPAQLLHDFGAALSGNFLKYSGGTVYGGEFSTGGLFSIDPSGANFDPLGTVSANYDGAFFDGAFYVSHAFNGSNRVSKFDLVPDPIGGRMISAGELILDTNGEFSGPLDFTGSGDLLYASAVRGLYRYSAAEVALAAAGPLDLALDPQHLTIADENFGYVASVVGNDVWGTSFTALKRVDTAARTSSEVATSNATIGHLEVGADTLYVNVTDFSERRSVVYAVVPEPGLPALFAGALAFGSARRRRGRTW